jgi:CRP-like cAMP-binding protein
VALTAAALKQIPLFESLSDADAETIVPVFNEVSFQPGREITKEGAPGFGFFVIESGNAKVTVRGEERTTVGPGDYFGEIALIDPGPRLATITAETNVVAHVLSATEFRPLIRENPGLAWSLLEGLCRILVREEADR